jgi:protein gp37
LKTSLSDYAGKGHIWWGVSVEDKKYGLPRIEHLRSTPAAVRFLSVEPLLEDIGTINLRGISWVIVGGESGPRARPIELDWIVSIRNQCKANKVPFFFKQWGGKNKKKAGRLLKGRPYNEFPKFQVGVVPKRSTRDDQIASISNSAQLVLL